MKTALTIAGSDSGGGAGIQADLKTFAAHGVYGTSAITAITAQNTLGVTAVHTVPADMVTAQIEAVITDIGVDAAKTGMLATAAIVEAVAAAIETFEIPRVVIDPVMIATNGDRLLEDEAVRALRAELLGRAFLVTPNTMEAEVLAGMSITSPRDAATAARRIHELGPTAVIVKGGHLPGPEVIDVLYDGHELIELRSPRIDSHQTHGTGCTFGAAITANLALGLTLRHATRSAQVYVANAIRSATRIGRGHGPLNHFWGK